MVSAGFSGYTFLHLTPDLLSTTHLFLSPSIYLHFHILLPLSFQSDQSEIVYMSHDVCRMNAAVFMFLNRLM